MEVSRRAFVASSAAFAGAAPAQESKAPPARRVLQSRFSADQFASLLIPVSQWKPYPTASDRDAWLSLPADVRKQMIADGEKALNGEWTFLPATVFLQFVRTGNRSNYERLMRSRRERLEALVRAECTEGQGRFLPSIADGVWAICEETFWGYPAHMGLQKNGPGLPDVNEPVIDLFAAEAAALLAWTDYLLAPQLDTVHKTFAQRIRTEIDRRILTPYEKRSDFWWMGLEADRAMNNWNPWINSNCLACALLIERNRERRAALTHKILRSVDRFVDSYHADGGCDEGPGYWGHAGGSLFDNLELLHNASRGKVNFFDIPLVAEIGKYIYRVHIADDWYVNFADASARVGLAGDLVYRYGVRIGDEQMKQFGAWAEQKGPKRFANMGRELPALFNLATIRKTEGRPPLLRDAWLPGIQVMTARVTEGSTKGLYLAAQGGHNAESHNHNDVGNFIIYADGHPVIIDVGVETYTAKTFSSNRYDIWTMQSGYHNLPTVNGMMQGAGRQFAARQVNHTATPDATEFSLDIAQAYPAEAGIETWRRTLRLDRAKNEILLRDVFSLEKAESLELTFMTNRQISIEPGKVHFENVRVIVPEGLFDVHVEGVKTEDARLKPVWGPLINRVRFRLKNVPARGELAIRFVQG